MLRIARRPRWIAALVLALAVAAGFALLSQWQLSRSVSTGTVVERPTETTLPLSEVATPQQPLMATADGQRVSVSGHFVPGDNLVLSDRYNGGAPGYWVVAHFATGGAGVAVALGWTPSKDEAQRAAAAFDGGEATVSGRLVADEGPQTGDFQSGALDTMSIAALVNVWAEVDAGGVYNGYIIDNTPVAGLEKIDSPIPSQEVELNWLNLFYAAEWVIFAGFAIFLWWRLVRDVWEREQTTASVD
ncbi:MAG: SURF1 family protein [Salinibacterium sp.]|nr:SURF1 family protein [Salinibacterium sp.]